MEQAAKAERRKYPRIPTDHLISFAPVSASERLAVGKNLSPGGICFEAVGCEISLGEVLRVTFNVDDHTVVAIGRVMWAIETDPITLEVGLTFIEIEPFALRLLEDLLRPEI